jgi:hypothetical protein
MSTSTATKRRTRSILEARVLREGYGPGAWHGPDFKAALADVAPESAFKRPATGRHNIAEIALHHAFYIRSVRAQISGVPADPFILEGEDWFEVNDATTLEWPRIVATVESEQKKLVKAIDNGGSSSLTDDGRFDLVLGITCHAIYHAGQIQLVKRLIGG